MNIEPKQVKRPESINTRKTEKWRFWFVLCGFTALASLLLLQEHRVHLWGLGLYLILLLCPLMLLVVYLEDKSLDRLFDKESQKYRDERRGGS